MNKLLATLLPALLAPLTLAPLAASPSNPNDPVASDEFPALQFLPVGSIVRGIVIPRYSEHRAVAKLCADEMLVATRSTVQLKRISATLYAPDKQNTRLDSEEARYSFKTDEVIADGDTSVHDPRFRAQGTAAVYSTGKGRGILHGPVHTTISTRNLNSRSRKP